MGYLGRRIGLSQDSGDSNPSGANGAVGGGILDLFAHGYFERQGDLYNAPTSSLSGMNASGGTAINEYQAPDGKYYRAHIFTGSGTFTVTETGTESPTAQSVEYLVVGGGGSGGTNKEGPPNGYGGGGGGAGGVRVALASHPLDGTNFAVSPGTSYPVVWLVLVVKLSIDESNLEEVEAILLLVHPVHLKELLQLVVDMEHLTTITIHRASCSCCLCRWRWWFRWWWMSYYIPNY